MFKDNLKKVLFLCIAQLCLIGFSNANMITIADGPNLINPPTSEGANALTTSRLSKDFPGRTFVPLAVETLYNVNNKKIGYLIISIEPPSVVNNNELQVVKEWVLKGAYGRLGPFPFSVIPIVLSRSVQPLDPSLVVPGLSGNFPTGYDFYFNPLTAYGGELNRYVGPDKDNVLIRCFQEWIPAGNPVNGQPPVNSYFTGALSGTKKYILDNCSIIAPRTDPVASFVGMSHCVELFSGAAGKYGGMNSDDDSP